MNYYVVKYTGPFGFIKPWTAVRDIETFSQQFLTPSILEGIEKKLFPYLLQTNTGIQKIKRYRLNYIGIDVQQERTWSKGGFKAEKKRDTDTGDRQQAIPRIDETAKADLFITPIASSYIAGSIGNADAIERAEKKLIDLMTDFKFENQMKKNDD
jgi:hypothetical protein